MQFLCVNSGFSHRLERLKYRCLRFYYSDLIAIDFYRGKKKSLSPSFPVKNTRSSVSPIGDLRYIRIHIGSENSGMPVKCLMLEDFSFTGS